MFFTFEFRKKAGRVSNAPCQIDILLIFDFFYIEIIKFGGGTYCEQSKKGTGKGHGVGVNFAANGSIQNKQYTVKASDSVNADHLRGL